MQRLIENLALRLAGGIIDIVLMANPLLLDALFGRPDDDGALDEYISTTAPR